MAAAIATTQINWTNDIAVLQQKVFSIIGKIVFNQDHISKLLDQTAMTKYWGKCFTHKSADVSYNNDTLEFYGDKCSNYVFASYLRDRFEDKIDQKECTLAQNRYMTKLFQAGLAEEMGLVQYLRYDPGDPKVSVSAKEDVFEAFFGCLNNLAEDRIQKGIGYIYCYNLMADIFNPIQIIFEKDDITKLKELYEKLGWGLPSYIPFNSDQPKLGEYRIEIRAKTGEVIGRAYGSARDASFKAALMALEALNKLGYTLEYAEEKKVERSRVRNPRFDLQYKRVELAVKKLNEMAKQQGKAQVTDFKIVQVESKKVEGGFRYTFALQIAYQTGPEKVAWMNAIQETGTDQDESKIKLMERFATTYGIPTNV